MTTKNANKLFNSYESLFEPRWTIGFYDLLNQFSDNNKARTAFPPYNINKDEQASPTRYYVELALAGYDENDVSVTVESNALVNVLTIASSNQDNSTEETIEPKYQYKGLANRKFTQRFFLSDSVEVEKAVFENGLLTVHVVTKAPSTKEVKTIAINSPKKEKK